MKRSTIIVIFLYFFLLSQWDCVIPWLWEKVGFLLCWDSNCILDWLFLIISIVSLLWALEIASREVYRLSNEQIPYIVIIITTYGYLRCDNQSPYFLTFSWGCLQNLKYLDVPLFGALIILILGRCPKIRMFFYLIRKWVRDICSGIVKSLDGEENSKEEEKRWLVRKFNKLLSKLKWYIRRALGKSRELLVDEPMIDVRNDDRLNFMPSLNAVVNIMNSHELSRTSAYSIGIVGEWGTGKSTFMYNLKLMLNSGEHGNWITVDFNPRTSQNASTIQEDFLRTFRRTLSRYHSDMSTTVSKYMRLLDIDSRTAWIWRLYAFFSSDEDELRQRISRCIEDLDCYVAVFIDDLDRLEKDEMIEVFKLISKNASFRRVVFVTGYSRRYVDRLFALPESGRNILDGTIIESETSKRGSKGDKYDTRSKVKLPPQEDFTSYADKYFKKEVMLSIQPEGIVHLFRSLIERHVLSESILSNDVLDFLSQYVRVNIQTPRDLKRYVNMLFEINPRVWNNVIPAELALVMLIKYVYFDVYEEIRDRKIVAPQSDGYGRLMAIQDYAPTKYYAEVQMLLSALMNYPPDVRKSGNVGNVKLISYHYKSIGQAVSFNNYFPSDVAEGGTDWSTYEALFDLANPKEDMKQTSDAFVTEKVSALLPEKTEELAAICLTKLREAVEADVLDTPEGQRVMTVVTQAALWVHNNQPQSVSNVFVRIVNDGTLNKKATAVVDNYIDKTTWNKMQGTT